MITFLYRHRLKPRLFSREWLKTWLKRIWTLPGLLGYCFQTLRLRVRGATIPPSTVLARLTPADSGGFFDHKGLALPW